MATLMDIAVRSLMHWGPVSVIDSTTLSPIDLSIYLWLYSPLLDLDRFSSFLILYTVGRDQPVARPLPTHRTTQTQKRTQTSMPWEGFEPTISAFEWAKTVHAIDRAAIAIGNKIKRGTRKETYPILLPKVKLLLKQFHSSVLNTKAIRT
jgi:hypothetical protein